MARQESDREDILREATALVERAELIVPGYDEPVVIGFRRDGSASVFVGQRLVFQFNARNELRRGYRDGQLLKADGGQLVSLRRERTESEVRLISRSLPADETATFLAAWQTFATTLQAALQSRQVQVTGQHPPGINLLDRITVWLTQQPSPPPIAHRPNVSG